MSETGGEEDAGWGGPDWDRSGGAPGVKNPTCLTFGSLTVRGTRRVSISGWRWGCGSGFCCYCVGGGNLGFKSVEVEEEGVQQSGFPGGRNMLRRPSCF